MLPTEQEGHVEQGLGQQILQRRGQQGLAIEPGYQALRHHDLPAYRAMLHSQDATEGPRAFGEKRAPQWRGV
jgi:enoyl-CoA hydratase/carnithine racemase